MILVVALSHLLLAAFLILFRADSVAETALALGGPFCHRLALALSISIAPSVQDCCAYFASRCLARKTAYVTWIDPEKGKRNNEARG